MEQKKNFISDDGHITWLELIDNTTDMRHRPPTVHGMALMTSEVLMKHTYTYIRLKKVDKRNLNRESYIGMHTVNYLGLVQIQIHIYSSWHME